MRAVPWPWLVVPMARPRSSEDWTRHLVSSHGPNAAPIMPVTHGKDGGQRGRASNLFGNAHRYRSRYGFRAERGCQGHVNAGYDADRNGGEDARGRPADHPSDDRQSGLADFLALTKQRHRKGDGGGSKQEMDQLNVDEIVLVVESCQPKESDQAADRKKHGVGKGMAPTAPTDLDGDCIDGECEPQVEQRRAGEVR